MLNNYNKGGVDLYVLLTQKTNADGTLMNGNWRGIYWINGVSVYVYSYDEAMKKRQLGLAHDIRLFKTIPFSEIEEWAQEYNLETLPKQPSYTVQDDSDNFVVKREIKATY